MRQLTKPSGGAGVPLGSPIRDPGWVGQCSPSVQRGYQHAALSPRASCDLCAVCDAA